MIKTFFFISKHQVTFIESTFNGNTTNKPSNKLQMIERKPVSSLLWLSISPSLLFVFSSLSSLVLLSSFSK